MAEGELHEERVHQGGGKMIHVQLKMHDLLCGVKLTRQQ